MGNNTTEDGDGEDGSSPEEAAVLEDDSLDVVMYCRRCSSQIAAGASANLVTRLRGELPLLPLLTISLIVCSPCLLPSEVGYQADVTNIVPPIRLTAGELAVLRDAARGRIYRAVRGTTKLFVLGEDSTQPSPHDKQVTSLGYKLVRHRIIDWLTVPAAERVANMPNAWAVVTDDGERHLLGDNPENEEEALTSARTRKVLDREVKAFVVAAHRGRCHTSESGMILERIGSWSAGNAEHLRRDLAGRAALEAGYVTHNEHGVFDSTKFGRAFYGLAPTPAHRAAELAAQMAPEGTTDDQPAAADEVHASAGR